MWGGVLKLSKHATGLGRTIFKLGICAVVLSVENALRPFCFSTETKNQTTDSSSSCRNPELEGGGGQLRLSGEIKLAVLSKVVVLNSHSSDVCTYSFDFF